MRAHVLWDRRDDRGLREREGERRDTENQERARRVLAVVAGCQASSSNGVRTGGSPGISLRIHSREAGRSIGCFS